MQTTPIHDALLERGAVMGQVAGWERPLWFAPEGVEARDRPSFQRPNWWDHVGREAIAMARGCGLSEMSSHAKFRVTGPAAVAFLDHVATARIPTRPGTVALSLLLTEEGGMVGDVTIDHQGSDGFYLVGSSLGVEFYRRWLDRQSSGFDVRIVNVSDRVAAIGVAGPNSRAMLNALSERAFDDFPFMTSRQVNVGPTTCRALRVSFSGSSDGNFIARCPASRPCSMH